MKFEQMTTEKVDPMACLSGAVCVLMERGITCTLLKGDGRELSRFADASIDCIITDHPWLDEASNQGGNRSFAAYDCFRYTIDDFREKARILKDGCFLAEMLPAENENNYDYLYQIKQDAKKAGFLYYSKVPWKKGGFVSNTGRKAKNTMDVMIFSKGKARALRPDVKRSQEKGELVKMSGANGMLPTAFDIPPVPKAQRIHPNEIPVELCENLIGYLTLPGEKVLDPFAGSGSLGVAALRTGRSSVLIEKDPGMVEKGKERLMAGAWRNIPER